MKTLRKLFFETKMTWVRVILFAVVTGVVTAALLIWPVTSGTSFADIGVSFEWWILFAVLIAANAEKPVEAGLKVFVFFLISQPLVYLLQVPFYSGGWEIFNYYPRWFIWTVLCLPGGMIAWFVKKQTVWSALILSMATAALTYEGVWYLSQVLNRPPYHLLTVIFCFAQAVMLILILLTGAKTRIVAGAITLAATVAAVWFTFFGTAGLPSFASLPLDEGHIWQVETQDEGGDIGEIRIDPDAPDSLHVTAEKYGRERVTIVNENGDRQVWTVICERRTGVRMEAE